MNEVFELACGSVTGREHRRLGRNNQDNFCVYQDRNLTVAVVADGCGSMPNSEVGAYIGSRMFLNELVSNYYQKFPDQDYGEGEPWLGLSLETIVECLSDAICLLAIGDGVTSADVIYKRFVANAFLFTICGAVITKETAYFFALGDGVFAINGEVTVIESENNAPNYLGYQLLPDGKQGRFDFFESIPTEFLESFVIGTDGVNDLITAEQKCLPGKSDTVGPLQQLWLEDRFYKNPDLLSRKLRLANTEVSRYNHELGQLEKHNGLLPDDTTLVVGRKKCPAQVAPNDSEPPTQKEQ